MLLKDFITETSSESKELISLATAILQNYSKNPRREIDADEIKLSFAEPSLEELVKHITIKFDNRFDRSLYNPRTKEVLIKLDNDFKIIKSSLVHELQHALDDLKSKGKFRQEKGDYVSRQSEVNARLAQAINDIELALQKVKLKNIDWKNPKVKDNVLKLIQSYLKIHNLTKNTVLDNKRYQRLINRIYNYITAR